MGLGEVFDAMKMFKEENERLRKEHDSGWIEITPTTLFT
jgi:hypothetical protein